MVLTETETESQLANEKQRNKKAKKQNKVLSLVLLCTASFYRAASQSACWGVCRTCVCGVGEVEHLEDRRTFVLSEFGEHGAVLCGTNDVAVAPFVYQASQYRRYARA